MKPERHAGHRRRASVAVSLALAALATATPSALAGTSLSADGLHAPTGTLIDPNGRMWVSDHMGGFCRVGEPSDDGAGQLENPREPGDIQLATCLGGLLPGAHPGPDAAGQPTLVDPSPEFAGSGDEIALIPDRMTMSSEVYRAVWDPETGLFRTRDTLTMIGHRGRPTTVVEGPDGHVYVSFQREATIQRIRNAAAPQPKVEVVGRTSDERGASAITPGLDAEGRTAVYVAEKLGGLRVLRPSAAQPPVGEPLGAAVPAVGAEAVSIVGAMAFDAEARHLYVGTAGADVPVVDVGADVVVRYPIAGGTPAPDEVARGFTAIGGLDLVRDEGTGDVRVLVADDPATIDPAEPLGFGRISRIGGRSATVSGPTHTNDTTPTFNVSGDGPLACGLRPAGSPASAIRWNPCADTLTADALAEGDHVLTVRPVDADDTASTARGIPAAHRFTVDTTAPATPVVLRPSGTVPVSVRPHFELGAERHATLECAFDGSDAFEPCATGRIRTFTGGSHSVVVRATDRAGNVSETSASRTFEVDPTLEAVAEAPVWEPAGTTGSKSLIAGGLHLSTGGLYDPAGRLWVTDHNAGFCRLTEPGMDAAGAIDHPLFAHDTDSTRTCLGGLRPHAGTGPDAAGQPALIDPTPGRPGNGDEMAFIPDGASHSNTVVRVQWNPDTGVFDYDRVIEVLLEKPRPTAVTAGVDPDGAGPLTAPLYVVTKEEDVVYRISDPAGDAPRVTVAARTSDGLGPLSLTAGTDAEGREVLYLGEPEGGVTVVRPGTGPTPPRAVPTPYAFPPKPNATPEEPDNGFAALAFDRERGLLYVGMGNAGEPTDGGIDVVHRVRIAGGTVDADWSRGYTAIGGLALRPDGNLVVFDDPALIDPAEPLATGRAFDVGGPSARVVSDARFFTTATPALEVAGDDGVQLRCWLRRAGTPASEAPAFADWADCTAGTVDPGLLTDGGYLLTVVAVQPPAGEGATEVVGIPAVHAFTVDTTAPAKPVITRPGDGLQPASPWLAFDGGERDLAYECRLGDAAAAWQPCVPGRPFTFTTDGPQTLTVRSTDQAGNVSRESEPKTFMVDGTPPTVTIASPVEGLRTKDRDLVFRFKASEEGVEYGCSLDGGRFARCDGPADEEGYITRRYEGLAHGTHTFEVHARDTGRNVGPVASRTIHVDTEGPVVEITEPAADTVTGTSATVTFAPSAGSVLGEESHTYECSLDGGPFASCASGKSFDGLAGGSHTIAVRGTDDLGNTGPVAERTWTVDATGPAITFDSPTPAEGAETSSSVIVAWHADEATRRFECTLNGQPLADCTSPRGLGGLEVGRSHAFTVRGIDAHGNAGPEATRTFTVRRATTIPPVLVNPAGTERGTPPTGPAVPLETLILDRRVDLDRLLQQGLPLQIRPVEGSTAVRLRIFRQPTTRERPVRPVNNGRNGNRRQQRKPALVQTPGQVQAVSAAARRTLVASKVTRVKGGESRRIVLRDRKVRGLKPGTYVLQVQGMRAGKPIGKATERVFRVVR